MRVAKIAECARKTASFAGTADSKCVLAEGYRQTRCTGERYSGTCGLLVNFGRFGGRAGSTGQAELDEWEKMNVFGLQHFQDGLTLGFGEERQTFLNEGGAIGFSGGCGL